MSDASLQHYGTGRRKTSAARVYLRPGSGKFTVNHRSFDEYFVSEMLKMIIRQPLIMTETADKFDVYVRVRGGGPTGQAGALRARGLYPGDGAVTSWGPASSWSYAYMRSTGHLSGTNLDGLTGHLCYTLGHCWHHLARLVYWGLSNRACVARNTGDIRRWCCTRF